MKALMLFLSLFLSLPFALSAQSIEGTLQKVSTALSASQWEQSVTLYRQAIKIDAERSEMFYWTEVDKNCPACPKLAQELSSYYKRARNYDKVYLFCKELLQQNPNDVNHLAACAEAEVCRGKEEEALRTYETILGLDANNLAANIFIGNYYYLKAEQEKQRIENDYKKISVPTRMQHARYKDGLSRVITTGYGKAKEYLQNVIRQFPSTEAQKTLNRIKLIEKEVNR